MLKLFTELTRVSAAVIPSILATFERPVRQKRPTTKLTVQKKN